jgi:hypothetical protein
MKSSRVTAPVNVELVSNLSETVSVSVIRVRVMGVEWYWIPSKVFMVLSHKQKFPTQSTLGQDTTDYLTPPTVPYVVLAVADDSFV